MPQTISVSVNRTLTNLEAVRISGCVLSIAWGYKGLTPFKSAGFTDMNPKYSLVQLGEVGEVIPSAQFDEAVRVRVGNRPVADLHSLCQAIKENPQILKEGPVALQCQNERGQFSSIIFFFQEGKNRFIVSKEATSAGKNWPGDYRTLVPYN